MGSLGAELGQPDPGSLLSVAFVDRLVGPGLDDEGELAPGLLEVGDGLGDRAAEDLLLQLRELAAGGDGAVAPGSRRCPAGRPSTGAASPRTTRVRSCAATDASSFSRSACFLGRNPRYTKLSPYMPDTEIAAVGAEGPGTVATVWPAPAAASTSQAPGVVDAGRARVGHEGHIVLSESRQEDRRLCAAVVLVVARQRRADFVPVEQAGA